MKAINWLKKGLRGLTEAIARFPLTTACLLVAATINAYDINIVDQSYTKYLFTLIVGAFLSAVAEVAYERWYTKLSTRFVLMSISVLLTVGYYLIIKDALVYDMALNIRTEVVLFALLIAFIWIPVIKSEISFNQSFMVVFKSFFIALFFSGVIFGGISIIIAATDQLIMNVDYKAYSHSANLIFLLFAPMYFLSLIPVYPGKASKDMDQDQLETINKAAHCPKFLEVLISYIIIPLITVFTLILVIYIVQNIGGEFWTDNLLEPMLVSYAITVILVYILASELENKFTVLFRKIFPKLLIPIVIFQIIASFITLTDTGITHTRYYVILFGIFAAISGVLLSSLPVRKNGMIAAILIVFATFSIIPPVDAFTISKTSQIRSLEEVLVKNDMLENNKITPNGSIADKDKEKITNAIYYLNMMNYTNELPYLPKNFNTYEDFRTVFGFDEYKDPEKFNSVGYAYVNVKQPTPINITGHDFFIQMDINLDASVVDDQLYEIKKAGKKYFLQKDVSKGKADIKLLDENKKEILIFKTEEIFDKFSAVQGEKIISVEEATFIKENEQAKMTFVVQNIDIQRQTDQPYTGAMIYVLVQIK